MQYIDELKPARFVVYREKKYEKLCQVIADHFDGIKCYFFVCFSSCDAHRFIQIFGCVPFQNYRTFFTRCIFLSHYQQSILHIRVMSLSQSESNPRMLYSVYSEASWHNWSNDLAFYLHNGKWSLLHTVRSAKVHFPLLHLFLNLLCGRILFPVSVALPANETYGFNAQRQIVTNKKKVVP